MFIDNWKSKLQTIETNFSLRTYVIFIKPIQTEPYQFLLKKTKFLQHLQGLEPDHLR